MVKRESNQKDNLYLLAIVSIVAIVGIVVLILNSTSSSVSLAANNIAGYAVLVGANTSNTTNATRYCGDGFCDPPEFGKCKKDCPMPPPKFPPMNTTNTTTTNTTNSTY